LLAQRKDNQKKEHPHACPTGSLRCSDELAGCETRATPSNSHAPKSPAHPALLGKPERDYEVKIQANIKGSIVGAPLGAIH